MKNGELQLMVYGDNISNATVTISYPGVRVKEVTAAESKKLSIRLPRNHRHGKTG